jgi:hypothetical protein
MLLLLARMHCTSRHEIQEQLFSSSAGAESLRGTRIDPRMH